MVLAFAMLTNEPALNIYTVVYKTRSGVLSSIVYYLYMYIIFLRTSHRVWLRSFVLVVVVVVVSLSHFAADVRRVFSAISRPVRHAIRSAAMRFYILD